jgi:hypothetical protein
VGSCYRLYYLICFSLIVLRLLRIALIAIFSVSSAFGFLNLEVQRFFFLVENNLFIMRNRNFTSFNFHLAIFLSYSRKSWGYWCNHFFSTSTSSMDVIESIILFNDTLKSSFSRISDSLVLVTGPA